jgi:hypothetical protein
MAKDKVTLNGEKNQEATGKQGPDVSLSDGFGQIEDTAKMLRFLISVSRRPDMQPDWAFVDTVREMLTQELSNLNGVMENLAKNYKGLIYRQVAVPNI